MKEPIVATKVFGELTVRVDEGTIYPVTLVEHSLNETRLCFTANIRDVITDLEESVEFLKSLLPETKPKKKKRKKQAKRK